MRKFKAYVLYVPLDQSIGLMSTSCLPLGYGSDTNHLPHSVSIPFGASDPSLSLCHPLCPGVVQCTETHRQAG